MPRALLVVLFVYGGLGLGLALNPTPNPYQKPRAMLLYYFFNPFPYIKFVVISPPIILIAGQVYRTNIMKPSQPIM